MRGAVLITGGAGFIGSNVAVALVERGWKVRVLDSLSPQIHGPAGDSPTRRAVERVAELVQADIRDVAAVTRALEGIDTVVHLAAETGTGQSMYEMGHYSDVNILGTAKLLDLLAGRAQATRRLVVASSRAIYGEGKYLCSAHGAVYPEARQDSAMRSGSFEPRCPVCGGELSLGLTDEDARVHPTSVYGVTKQVQEQLVLMFGESKKIPAIALRYQNVYGPGQSLSNPYTGILSIFSTRFRANGSVNIFEDGRESRDFVYIDDVVAATVTAVEAAPEVTGPFNIGSGKPVDVLHVADTLKSAFASSGEIRVSGNYRVGDIRHNCADISRAERLLQWTPRVGFEAGISRFIEWVRGQEASSDGYEHSLQEMKERGLFK